MAEPFARGADERASGVDLNFDAKLKKDLKCDAKSEMGLNFDAKSKKSLSSDAR